MVRGVSLTESAGLTRHSLRDDAVRVLRARINSGAFVPDTIYAVGQVAEELKVSITPIREALLTLAQDGLIEMLRNKGFKVRVLSERELDNIIDLRLMIEPVAMREVAQRRLVTDLQPLRALAARADQAAEAGNWTEFLDCDRQMHLQLLESLNNPYLVDAVSRLRDQSRLYGLNKVAGTEAFRVSTHEHSTILDAVERGDGPAAERLTAHHITHTRGVWAGKSEPLR
jgi:DNA-binding GntR family transcriptional regulator